MRVIPFSIIALFLFASLFASEWSDTKRGIKNFEQGDYDEALKSFQRAKDASSEKPITMFNLGTALYKSGKIGEAAKEFSDAVTADTAIVDTAMAENSLYNIGNCAYKADSFKQAAKFYKSSLILDQNDEDAKYNLELALRHLQNQSKSQNKQNKQQQNQKQQNQKQQNQKQQNQKNQQQNQKQQNQQQQQKQQQQQQQQAQQQQAQQQKKKPGQLSKKEAERLMEAMERQENELLKDWMKGKKKKRMSGSRYNNPKDW